MGSFVSRAFRLSLAFTLLFGLTLGLKIATASRLAHADEVRLARDMSAMLEMDGYRVTIVAHHLFAIVRAEKDGCTLVAANAVANGYLRRRFESAAERIGPTSYNHGSARGTGFPRFLPVAAEHLQNWAYRFGIVAPRTPVIAIAATPACRLESIAWSTLQVWPAPLPRPDARQR